MRNRLFPILLLALAGCGGGGDSTSTRAGRVRISIEWPEATRAADSRYIPPYAASLVFEMYPKGEPAKRYQLVANRPDSRPSTQTVEFKTLFPAGTYVLAGAARQDLGGLGATLASAASEVLVPAGAVASVDLTFKSTIKNLEIQGQPLRLGVGTKLTLTGRALDPDGKVLLLPAGALKWSLVSGSGFGTLTEAGEFTATAPGTARVRLSEPGAAITAEADVQVVASGGGGLADSGWPKAFGDLLNSSRAGSGPAAAGTLKWKLDGVGNALAEQPAIAKDGTLYVNRSGRIAAVNPASGAVTWQSSDIGTPACGITIGEDGTLYTVITTGSGFQAVAVNRTTGGVKWTIPLDTQDEPRSTAVGANGLVYVQASRPNGQPGGKVYAIDAAAGTVRWSNALGGCYEYGVTIGPDGTVYTAGDDGWLYALDGATGVQKWKSQTWVRNNVPAIAANGTLYVNVYRGFVRALNASSGSKLWDADIGTGRIANGPVAVGPDGTVYTGTNNFPGTGGRVTAVNGTTGAIKWSVVLDGFTANGLAVAADGTVYASLQNSGKLVALNPTTGAVKWTYQSDGVAPSVPAIGPDGSVYFTTGPGLQASLVAVK